ncbi:MAG: HAD hydrolase-like protein [Cryobacterium sp.]|nr:HAD hydrolase-like protein [Cryobacterium sp.]
MNTTVHTIETVVLDLAGTTVIDDGLVVEAFTRAWDREQSHVDESQRSHAVQLVHDTMGQSKIDVFRQLLPEHAARSLNTAFENAYDELVAEGRCVPVPGAREVLEALKAEGRKVALTTGFARRTADGILTSLGWHELADVTLTPAEAGRGRPAPDLNLTALIRTGASSVVALAVVGDTVSDVRSGVAAGAGLVVGVLTGAETGDALRAAGAHAVLGSVVELPDLLKRQGR